MPPDPPRAKALPRAERDRLARKAARLWGYVTLSGVLTLSLFVIWHLIRRGRLLRARATAIRNVRLPELPLDSPGQGGST